MKQSELVRRLMIAYTEPRSTFGGGLLRLIEELETEERAAASGVPVGQAHAVPRDEDNLAKSLWDAFVSAEDDAASSAFFDAWSCIEQWSEIPEPAKNLLRSVANAVHKDQPRAEPISDEELKRLIAEESDVTIGGPGVRRIAALVRRLASEGRI